MPTYKGLRCSLTGANGGATADRTGFDNTDAIQYKEHQITIDDTENIARCYVEVVTGTLEIELAITDLEQDHILVRIEIDGSPRVQRLVPLGHRGVSQLLQFRATEYCEDAKWFSKVWMFRPIAPRKMLRASRTQDGYGSVVVSIFRIEDVLRLEEGSLNYDISTWVVKKGIWLSPSIPNYDYQNKQLTQVVLHSNSIKSTNTVRENGKAQHWAIHNAMGHDWKVIDESECGSTTHNSDTIKPFAKFVFEYREKEKIPSPHEELESEPGMPRGRGRSYSLTPYGGTCMKRQPHFHRNESVSDRRSYSMFHPSFSDRFDLTTDKGVAAHDKYAQEIKAQNQAKQRSAQVPDLTAQILGIEAKNEKAQAARLVEIHKMSVALRKKEEEMIALRDRANELMDHHQRAIREEVAELEQRVTELADAERKKSRQTLAFSKAAASKSPSRGRSSSSTSTRMQETSDQGKSDVAPRALHDIWTRGFPWKQGPRTTDQPNATSKASTGLSEIQKGKQKAEGQNVIQIPSGSNDASDEDEL